MYLIERWAGDGKAWRCPNLANSIARFAIFNHSPEIIRLIVMMYLRSPLSLRNLQDLLFERGIDTFQETVGLWWNRFAPCVRLTFGVSGQAGRASHTPTAQWLAIMQAQSPLLSVQHYELRFICD